MVPALLLQKWPLFLEHVELAVVVVDEARRRIPLDAAQPDPVSGAKACRECAQRRSCPVLKSRLSSSPVEFGGGLEHAVAGPGAVVEV